MASSTDQEVSALASVTGTKKPLPNLRQDFFAAILNGTISVGGVAAGKIMLTASVGIFAGAGTPEGNLAAGASSLYLRTDGTTGSLVYSKMSGTGNTGWTAIV